MVRLPSEYQEVEYIESTGTQYFYSNVDIQDGLTVDSRQTFATGNDSYLFGGQGDTDTNSKTCFNGNWSSKIQGAYPSSYYNVGRVNNNNKTLYHVVTTHANEVRKCVVNDVEIMNVSTGAFVPTTGKCLCFGWRNQSNQPKNFYKGKVYSLKVRKDDVLLADFIPCYRKSDDEIGMYDTVSKTFYVNQGTGTFLKGNDVSYSTESLIESRRKILLNTPHVEEAFGVSSLSFNTDMAANLKECKIYFAPVQEGSGDPSPENVRPIRGWDGVTVTICGKNLYPYSGGSIGAYQPIYLKAGETYTFSANPVDGNPYARVKYIDGTTSNMVWLSNLSSDGRHYNTFIPTKDVIGAFIFLGVGLTDPLIEQGSTATEYEPYKGTSVTIDWGDTIGTIYGGYVDLAKGELVETWKEITFDGVNMAMNSDYTINGIITAAKVYFPFSYNREKSYMVNNMASHPRATSNPTPYFWMYTGNYGGVALGLESDYPEAITAQQRIALVNNWLQENPVTVVGELKTPITHSLTPQQINTLKGLNLISHNMNGNVNITYWTH